MKAKIISKLRKKIQKKGYYEKRWEVYSKKCEEWNDFYRWNCREFFVGEERAERNLYKYNRLGLRDERKCEYYRKKVMGD